MHFLEVIKHCKENLYVHIIFTFHFIPTLQFKDNGYLIIPDFADEATIESLKQECHRLVEDMNPAEHNTVFTTLEMKRVWTFVIIE